MPVAQDVCLKLGHSIQSHVVGQQIVPHPVDPKQVVVVNKYEAFCTLCGLTRDVAMNYRPRSGKKKAKNNGGSSQETGNTEERS